MRAPKLKLYGIDRLTTFGKLQPRKRITVTMKKTFVIVKTGQNLKKKLLHSEKWNPRSCFQRFIIAVYSSCNERQRGPTAHETSSSTCCRGTTLLVNETSTKKFRARNLSRSWTPSVTRPGTCGTLLKIGLLVLLLLITNGFFELSLRCMSPRL